MCTRFANITMMGTNARMQLEAHGMGNEKLRILSSILSILSTTILLFCRSVVALTVTPFSSGPNAMLCCDP